MFRLFVWLVLVCVPIVSPQAQSSETLSDTGNNQLIIDRLMTTPVLHNTSGERLVEIFQAGQSLGNRATVFTKVGDSNTTNGDFMRPLGMEGAFCDLGPYADLQETIDFFSTPPYDGARNSFDSESRAAFPGLSSSGALDPFWADAPCESNESPLACEYRLVKPSIAILMVGLMDVRYETDTATYRDNMERIIEFSIEQGVIPVLTTIVVLPDQKQLSYAISLEINNIMLDLADQYKIPLINLWAAVHSLPDYGIGPDRTHLKAEIGKFCSFNGSEKELGGTLRNLLTLQMLDELRRNVLAHQ